VLSAAVSTSYPLNPESAGGANQRLVIEGRPSRPGEKPPMVYPRAVTPDYFTTLGIPLVSGRLFTSLDKEEMPLVALINRTAARHYWPGEDPLGRRVSFDNGENWARVVGIVGDVREFGLDKEPVDEVYLTQAQNPGPGCILVRTSMNGMTLANELRRAIREVDAQTAIPNVQTLEQARDASVASPRVMTDLLAIFAGLALAIAVFGIGGILALMVNQRLSEIGIRMALGARPRELLGMILGQGMRLVAIGLAAGVASAIGLTRLMRTLLFEVQPTDPITFSVVSMIFAAAALAACYFPARRALRVDPVQALRSE